MWAIRNRFFLDIKMHSCVIETFIENHRLSYQSCLIHLQENSSTNPPSPAAPGNVARGTAQGGNLSVRGPAENIIGSARLWGRKQRKRMSKQDGFSSMVTVSDHGASLQR